MSEWVSVKDRLPASAGSYLVATKNGGVMMTHFYQGSHGAPGKFSSTRLNALVTPWMERPKPPDPPKPVDGFTRTNADRIRAMSDEELAEFLDGVHGFPCEACCDNLSLCRRNNAMEPICKRHYLDWLRK